MTSEAEMSKTQLLERIQTGWEELMGVLVGLDDATKERVAPESGWTIGDHLFHLAAWEQGIAYLLTGRARTEGMGITAEQWRDLTMDQINDLVRERGQGRPAAEAMATLRMAHDEMLTALAGLDDADLQRGYSTFDHQSKENNRPIIGWIVGDTYDHYAEHLGYIRTMLAG
jgi:hypothetical protein